MIGKFIKKHIIAAMIGCLMLASVKPLVSQAASSSELTQEKPGYGVVETADGGMAKVWLNPFTSSVQVGGLSYGDNVMIIGENGIYYIVQYNEHGSTGYVAKSAVSYKPTNFYLKTNISSGSLNLRKYANTSSDVLASIPNGKSFAYIEMSSTSWYKAVYGNKTGYTSAQYTELCDY